MKRSKSPVKAHLPACLLGCLMVLALAAGATAAHAQADTSCVTGLPLISPPDVAVTYEEAPVEGNLLSWAPVSTDSAACYTVLDIPEGRPWEVVVSGTYRAISDRDFNFEVVNNGIIGDVTVERLDVNWTSRNEVRGYVAGGMNLSNSGGIYSIDLGTETAVQANIGIPSYLPRTNIRALGAWVAPDGGSSRIYGVVPGLPVIVSTDGGGTWSEPLLNADDPLRLALRSTNTPGIVMTVSPEDPNIILVGYGDGVFRSVDGGGTFERIGRSISSGKQLVTYLDYEPVTGRLFLAINGLGLWESPDDGDSWVELASLRVPRADSSSPDADRTSRPVVFDISASPDDPNLLYVGLRSWGVYASPDGGETWERRDSGMVYGPGPLFPNGRKVEVRAIHIDRSNPSHLLAASSSAGLFVSEDGGFSWSDSTAFVPADSTGRELSLIRILQNDANPLEYFAATPSAGILHSVDGGVLWTDWYEEAAAPPFTRDVGDLIWHPTEAGKLIMGSEGGGVYEPGTPIVLSNTIDPNTTDDALADLDIGLTVTFVPLENGGPMETGQKFRIRAQTFQGYAVWRAQDLDPTSSEPQWQLIGLYDRTNPEFCFANPCDALNPIRIQGCFADKRANCFSLDNPDGRITFFDRDIFNGFTYYYAISTFDYGFTGNVSATALARDMEYSPRSPQESSSQAQDHIGEGNYNEKVFTVNQAPAQDLSQIWVVPNPLRRSAGWDTGEEASVRFVGVTTGSRAEIFTLAGDLVVELDNAMGNDGQQKGNIVWNTRNAQGESVASGVYIWRITNEQGEEKVGKLTIIR